MHHSIIKKLPEGPGVYLFKDKNGIILYIGKAGNLRRRVLSYFQKAHDSRIEKLVSETKRVSYKKTDSVIEALILESELIKKYEPLYNTHEKDDKSFLYVEITQEEFPRVLLVRGKIKTNGLRFGPFTSASSIREALRILRKIFPWNSHSPDKTFTRLASYDAITGQKIKPCFDYELGLCPGVCIGVIKRSDYLKTIKHIKLFFQGRKKRILYNLQKEMKQASKKLEFEKAEKIKKQIFALNHIQDIALIKNYKLEIKNSAKRIEAYDVSNISGAFAVGAMIVFENNKPNKNEYRKFKIQTINTPNDVGMLKEVLSRRLKHKEWELPNLILIDGGKGQIHTAENVLMEQGLKIPVIGIAKGVKRKKNEFFGEIPKWTDVQTLIQLRNEAHRFAILYHRQERNRALTF